MTHNYIFDVIIIGGSYSGLAAGMALGRAIRTALIIDDGNPCNRQTPYSHNFLTNDGKSPGDIAALAKMQVSRYETIKFFKGLAIAAQRTARGFDVQTVSGETFSAKKLIFATGIRDILPDIAGFAECWGISVIHCPYCHGYEVRNTITGIFSGGDTAFDLVRLISNWTDDLTLLTHGLFTLSAEQSAKLVSHNIQIIDKQIQQLKHFDGHLQSVIFKDGTSKSLRALYAPAPFEQHSKIPQSLGCELTEDGYIKVDQFQETSIQGVYASGDNTNRIRTVANAVATGTTAGIAVSKKMILENF